jgi:hypothetical protein
MVSTVMIGLGAWRYTLADSSSTVSWIHIYAIDAYMFDTLVVIDKLLMFLAFMHFSVGCLPHA